MKSLGDNRIMNPPPPSLVSGGLLNFCLIFHSLVSSVLLQPTKCSNYFEQQVGNINCLLFGVGRAINI